MMNRDVHQPFNQGEFGSQNCFILMFAQTLEHFNYIHHLTKRRPMQMQISTENMYATHSMRHVCTLMRTEFRYTLYQNVYMRKLLIYS